MSVSCITSSPILSHVPVCVSCGWRQSWDSDLYQLRKKKKTADSSGKLCLSCPLYYPTCSSWKSVCETEGESCVCPLKLMACAVGKWMICTFSARCSHNENLSEQIMPNSHAPSVHRLACDTREEIMCRFQPLPTACDSQSLEFLPHWKMVLCLLLPKHCCIVLAMLCCN